MGNQCEPCKQTDQQPHPYQSSSQSLTYTIKSNQEYYDVDMLTNDAFFYGYVSQGYWVKRAMKLKKNFKIGRYYYGEWGHGVPQGRGILYVPSKILIDANFVNGVPSSPAKIIFIPTNNEYEGQLQDGKINGKGTMINHNEMYTFSGEWKNSKPQTGSLLLTKDRNIEKVQFMDFDRRLSKIFYRDGRIYEGEIDCKKLIPHGRGRVRFGTFDVKDNYDGDWKNGLYDGFGTFYWKSGQSYMGAYKNGLKNGHGKFKFLTGSEYEGGWLDGKQHGIGILWDRNGFKLRQGQWKQGTYIGPDRFHNHYSNDIHSPDKNPSIVVNQNHPINHHPISISPMTKVYYQSPEKISQQFLGQNFDDIMQYHVTQGIKRSNTLESPRGLKMDDIRRNG